MIWGFLTVLILGLTLLFGAPFWDFLAPSEHMTLLTFNPDTQEYVVLATGSETLWYQWQSWSYIAVFCLILSLVLGGLYCLIRQLSDSSLIEAQQKLAQKAEEMEQLKRQYRAQVEKSVRHEYDKEAERLNHKALIVDERLKKATDMDSESLERLKMINVAARRQKKETQSKLGQRDRLREEKKLIAGFLDRCNWTLSDGSKITYSALKKLAKEHS